MPETNTRTELVAGVDLGGTKILAGVFNASLGCVGTAKISTKAQRGPDAVIERIARCVQDAADEADVPLKQIKGIGLGAPGVVDFEGGNVIFAPNLDWENVPLKKALEKHLDVPVFVENDANIAVLGVHAVELKSKPKHVVGVFVGTGIGGGLILNGELYRGANGTAGEIGHMVVAVDGPKCGCGNNGCLEALASRSAIFQQVKSGIKDGQKTILTDLLGDSLEDLRSGDLRKAIRRGDKFVGKIVGQAAEYLGQGIANLVNLLGPEVVVLGGGVVEALADEMLDIIVKAAKERALPGTMKGVEIFASRLGDDAGITGGAVLARRAVKSA